MAKDILYILLGGGVGSLGRYFIAEITPHYYKNDFPLGTFIANIIGCFIIGIFAAVISNNSNLDALLVTGFCGGFTTFSSFSKETFLLIHNQKIKLALLYSLLSTTLGILAVFGGYLTGGQ